ncbi:MAG TPA: HAD family phosphatase [Bryobacteraceae bacterium]|nr:HAD family phosphatase [Bryobacteraceae bacterium]
MTPVSAFLFDMDGVIVNSNPMHRQAWEAFNRRYGLDTTEEMHQRMYGRRNDQIVRDYFGEQLSDEEVSARGFAKEALYREMAGGNVESMLVPGLKQFLDKYRHIPKAVASNAEPANVHFILDTAGLRPYFQVVVDGHQVSYPKPNPEIYLKAAELLKIEKAECVVFEDSHSGVAAGKAAGMRVIGLGTTHVDLPGTELTIDNFSSGELEAWLAVYDLARK